MKSALFLITSDPLANGRAVEGLRIAAGVQGWQSLRVRVFLDDVVARALASSADGLEEDALIRQCLPMLGQGDTPILVGESHLAGLSGEDWEAIFAAVDKRRLAQLAAESNWVLHF